jgi:predicted ATPase
LKRQEKILDLFQGEFLADLPALDSNVFNEWYILKRERLHQLALNANVHLANYYERRGDLRKSLAFIVMQLELEPWREESHFQAMRIYALLGERSRALAQFQTCINVLREEFGVEPTRDTQKLAEAIGRNEITAQKTIYSVPNLPPEFVGRQAEIEALVQTVSEGKQRLITLLGPGGIGKSTTAVALAEALRGLFRDGIVFVPLSDSDDLLSSIAENVGFEGALSESGLMDYLRDRDILLVLDNFEHLHSLGCFVGEMISACTDLQVIVTSRTLLGVREEYVCHLDGLSFPDRADLNQWRQYDAMVLLFNLIRQKNPAYQESGRNIESLRGIAEKLEGYPLAIEFAAAFIAQNSEAELLQVLDKAFDPAEIGIRDIQERHQSLEYIFDQSWQLLEETERAKIASLALFRGGFSLDAASKAAGVNEDEITEFIKKSLITEDDRGRYRIHEVTRQFALERIPPDDAIRKQHAVYFSNLPGYSLNYPSLEQLDQLKREAANIKLAWEWALENERNDLLINLVPNVLAISLLRGPLDFGNNLFTRARTELDLDQDIELKKAINFGLAKLFLIQMRFNEIVFLMEELPVSARTRFTQGQALCAKGEFLKARPLLMEAVEMNNSLGDSYLEMDCLRELGNIANRLVKYDEAVFYYQKCLDLSHELGDKRNESAILNNWASVDWDLGNLDAAEIRYRQALGLYRVLGNRSGEAKALNNLSNVLAEQGDLERSLSYGFDALAIHKDMGNIRGQSVVFNNLGATYHALKQFDAARKYYLKALALYRLVENKQAIAETLSNLSFLDGMQGKLEEGRQKAQEAIGLAEAAGDKLNLSNSYYYLGRIEVAGGYLERAEVDFKKAYELRQSVPHPGRLLEIEVEMMNIAYQRREFDMAKQLMDAALAKMESVESTNDPDRIKDLLAWIRSKL